MRVLGIESSCDELSCAIVDGGGSVLSNVVHSQEDLHRRFGGIVPEVASRDHVRRLEAVLETCLEDAGLTLHEVDALAVTAGPGLVGSLLCGLNFTKGLSLATGLPMLGVHHLEGHIASADLEEGPPPEPPFTALMVSGGHTLLLDVAARGGPYRVLGRSRDDAAGEAFDKTAKLLGLGYPGGATIDRLARGGDPHAVTFPKLMQGKPDYSFSGLKTEVRRRVEANGPFEGRVLADFCAGFQEAVVESLLEKAFNVARDQLVLVGGVAANSRLRARALKLGAANGVSVRLPSLAFCTDNAAMIARAGQIRLERGERSNLDLEARARWPLEELPS